MQCATRAFVLPNYSCPGTRFVFHTCKPIARRNIYLPKAQYPNMHPDVSAWLHSFIILYIPKVGKSSLYFESK